MKIFTTDIINEIIKKENLAEKISRYDKIWHNNIQGVRKCHIKFSFTIEELREYVKCAKSVQYFAENYCYVFSPERIPVIISLFDYQKEILKLIDEKKFVINFASRQVGIGVVYAIYFLHQIIFNTSKIKIISLKSCNSVELIQKIKAIYKLLPFFLKPGIFNWNEKNISFDNSSNISVITSTKEPSVATDIDILLFQDFSRFPEQLGIFNTFLPLIKSKDNSKFIIHSGPNGANFFYELVKNSELPEGHPDKNSFETMRTYWWQRPGRDEEWKKEQIKLLGSEMYFIQEYELAFLIEKKAYDIIY